MQTLSNNLLQEFKDKIVVRYQLYNSLFSSLPFYRIEKTGVLLSLFLLHCEEEYEKSQSPMDIVESFVHQYTSRDDEHKVLDMLFRFIQYVERQVVLFDALEDASFTSFHDMQGQGSLRQLLTQVEQQNKENEFENKLKDFCVRIVLTAHPTQFYPGEVLGIINDMAKALSQYDSPNVNMYMQQLGVTPFLKKKKPTPYDEALSLIWYLENIFYSAVGNIASELHAHIPTIFDNKSSIIRMGFWSGGDRDGNPFVKSDTTVLVAEQLHQAILRCYYKDIRELRHRLTFKGVEEDVTALEKLFNAVLFEGKQDTITKEGLLNFLQNLRRKIMEQYNGLFVEWVDNLVGKVRVFGTYFATLDIRQDSRVHRHLMAYLSQTKNGLPENYNDLSEDEKIDVLVKIDKPVNENLLEDEVYKDTFESIKAIKTIQQKNSENGCNRYIISQCGGATDVMEVYGLLKLSGWKESEMTIDILPLFETIDDLRNAATVMEKLYNNQAYRYHLQQRGNTQPIMLGFSDGTKDGGYLMANWYIFKAKRELTYISRKYEIDVVFFDGRGGPPARGGGKTHKFYASLGSDVENKEIQITIQGQTISSNFGTVESAQFNIEQLLNAGISNDVLHALNDTLTIAESDLLESLSEESFKAYNTLKNHPYFMEYLSYASPLKFYGETNIGSRPTKRNASAKLTLDDLRAIPYVASWSQIKQNVTGYYGVGTALQEMEKAGKFKEVQDLYKNSLFFRTLIENSEMSMKKCFFPLTQFHAKHPIYGEVWQMIYDEYLLTEKMILRLSGQSELMANYPIESLSIQMRERLVLPLLTIQQYGLYKYMQMQQSDTENELKEVYEKLIVRCSFGIINAGRNSA